MSPSRNFAILGLMLAGIACQRLQPNYCPGAPDNNCLEKGSMPDAMTPDMAAGCSSNKDCASPLGVCDMPSGRCVQCTASTDCSQMAPMCGSDNICFACKVNSDCESSQVCLPGGACASATDVAYMRADVTDDVYNCALIAPTPCCTQMAPCRSLQTALTARRPYIKIAPGVFHADGTSINNSTVSNKITILGDAGAILTIANQGPVLTIQGSVDVEIHNLEFMGANGSGASAGDGISILGDSTGGPTLSLVRIKIDNNGNYGINATAGIISVTQSTIFDNDKGGIFVSSSATSANISNCFVYGNGKDIANTNSSIGGLLLQPTMTSHFKFNTVVDNNSTASFLMAGGVSCNKTASTVSADYNILVGNTTSVFNNGTKTYTNSTGTQAAGAASFADSFVSASPTASELQFRNPPTDYHILSGTKVIGKVTDKEACTMIGVDFDGDSRTQGACDLGADELASGQN